jgi:2-oxoglutarate dehydrogenase E2 component (dihydrolipoamide succinyltransferase)
VSNHEIEKQTNMAKVELIMPKMGESIMEATILGWLKQPGDTVEMDEPILEIATDKVDSEVPSPVDGVIEEVLFEVDDVVEVGKVIAIISTEATIEDAVQDDAPEPVAEAEISTQNVVQENKIEHTTSNDYSETERFYSPLVKSIAKAENIELEELENISGSGANGRVTKDDILNYLNNRTAQTPVTKPQTAVKKAETPKSVEQKTVQSKSAVSVSGDVEIIQMDRMRKLIAKHMVDSKRIAPHVTSFVEADVTNIVKWRNANKKQFQERHGEKITFTPIFVEAVAKAIQDFPLINVSVDGDTIIRKKDINIGIATALPSGNLIVPVVKNADQYSLLGIAKQVNGLVAKARNNKLSPDDIQNGTFTLTNVGTFGNLSGTPIINQPQVAILSVGAIIKKPAVVETEYGDVIAIRHLMMMSLSYDHRVVDGFLGGSYLRRVADYLEQFDVNQTI